MFGGVILQEVANSAVLGAAYRAKHGLLHKEGVSFTKMTESLPPPALACQPYSDSHQVSNNHYL